MFKKEKDEKKVFLIVNSYFIGDILLTNSLIQNIKNLYPDSVIIMVTSEVLQDVAKYQTGVDEVIIWDRKGKDKGIKGMFSFLHRLHEKYKKVFAAFPIYGMDRPVVLSRMTNPKYILAPRRKGIISKLIKSEYPFAFEGQSTQESMMNLLRGITKEKLQDVPMSYDVPDIEMDFDFNFNVPYITLCPVTSRVSKDIPYETVSQIISQYNGNIVLLGHGQVIKDYSQKLKTENHPNLIDLTNKTTIPEAAKIIKHSKGTIAADTGLMHLACAVKTPVAAVFYIDYKSMYMPDENMYKAKVISKEQSAENIISALSDLINNV